MAKTVRDYFSDLTFELERHFHLLPGDNAGEPGRYHLVSDNVARTDKRLIVFYIQRGESEITRVTYTLPVSAVAAPLFKKTGIQPSDGPTFARIRPTVEEDRVTRNVISWESEMERIAEVERTAEEGPLKRTAHNINIYWGAMRSMMTAAVRKTGIRLSSMRSTSASASASASASSSSSSRSSSNRRPRRTVRQRRSLSDPRRPASYKSNSDPKPGSGSGSGSRRKRPDLN